MKTTSKKYSSADIAALAGVSQATVSRVLSGNPNVRPETRAKVMKFVKEVGYRPNPFAQAMRTQLSGAVGVVVSRITNPIVPEILEALSTKLSELGRRAIVWNTDTDGVDGFLHAAQSGVVDGAIFTAASEQVAAVEAMLANGRPVVSINRHVREVDIDQVVSANFQGAHGVAKYLAENGRRKIAFVNGPLNRTTLSEREAGFRQGLQDAGLELHEHFYAQSDFVEGAFREIAIKLASGPETPDAIACGNDLIAFGVLNGLRAAGVSVPQDVWVTGFDGISMTAWDIINLTTVRQPLQAMAASAAEMLIDRIEGREQPPRVIEFRPELIIRGSTGDTPAKKQRH